ncbi:MAG: carboxypeptidase regulatory-like domain-containing protein, partial [Chitinophagaceae bacterium]
MQIIHAQETNTYVSGKVMTAENEPLSKATITVIHETTQNKYVSLTRDDGNFNFFNLKPGGPYTIIVSYSGYETIKKEGFYFDLDHSEYYNTPLTFNLTIKQNVLSEVTITNNLHNNTNGIETNINNIKLITLPSISRNLQDFIRLIPQAKVSGEGAMSLAGQNNRFNAFFIDGANNNDILGLAVSGINGGQTGAPPISIEAIEEIKVLLAPYDVQYGNFTGGSINAITRSGSNENKASAWYYFRNENLAGRSPVQIEKPGSPGIFYRPRLSHFFNQTAGAWVSGALIKNKLFYFTLLEKQSEVRPQPFNTIEYKGTSNLQQLNALAETLKNKYHYDPGSFLETKDELNATRLIVKFDWNASVKNKFMLSYRYNNAERFAPRVLSSATSIFFQNSGPILPAKTHSGSFEWKRFFTKDMNNRLLLTITSQVEDRRWIGEPFPRVSIMDGKGSIVFGSDANGVVSVFKATDFSLVDAFKFIKKQHVFTIGTDINYSNLNNININSYFGNYQFRSLNDFMQANLPTRLRRSFSFVDVPKGDDTKANSKFVTLRTSSFINDDIRIGTNFKINIGLRLDRNAMPAKPPEDKFFNDSAISIISKYHDLDGARSGKTMNAQWILSPRVGFNYNLPKRTIIIKGGAGIFSGHIINVWASSIYSKGIGNLDINPQQYGLPFIADPYGQPTPQSLNIDLSKELYLIAPGLKFPSVLKSSIAIEKKLKNNWAFSIEGIFTKNINEMLFRNINILPPIGKSALPNTRNIYSLNSSPNKIPLRRNGVNPYTQLFLLTNNHEKKGSSYSLSFIINKQVNNFSFNSSYTYGKSNVLFEITGGTTPIRNQWETVETVNGKNFVTTSISDNDMKHRIAAYFSKKVDYTKSKTATTITLFYNGQSGSPYSYVYSGSIINDNGNRENYDLIYIPTVTDLSAMNFIPNTVEQVTYSPQQQKDLLNDFIETDKYLNNHRGEFAVRNGARFPFTHMVDLRLQQDLKIKMKNKKVGLSITYDVFNFTNLLNKNWGKIYFLSDDN